MGTILLILVDESLSMRSRKNEVINGINRFLEVQRKINPDSCKLILIKFNSNVTVMHNGTDISEVEPLRSVDYNPCGKTALFDAIITGIKLTNDIKQKEDRVIAIAITDGEDTASKENVSTKAVKKQVAKIDFKPDWSITYIGKPPEYWSRTKPVSKVSYDGNAQRQVYSYFNKPSTSAIRRLKEYNNRRNSLQQQQLLCG